MLKNDANVKAKFCQKVQERCRNSGNNDKKWKTLQEALVKSAEECIPKTSITVMKKWMASEILEQMELKCREMGMGIEDWIERFCVE